MAERVERLVAAALALQAEDAEDAHWDPWWQLSIEASGTQAGAFVLGYPCKFLLDRF